MNVPKYLTRRSAAYKRIFLDERGHPTRSGEVVLAHLRRFCRANSSSITVSQTSGMVDPLATAVAEGRREVWNTIQSYLNLDEATLAKVREEGEEESDGG